MANQQQPMPHHEDPGSDDARQRIARQAVAAVRAGDTEAFGQVVELYKDRIMSLCVALMRDANEAEELAQDVFVRAYRYLDTFDERRDIYPWLATIAYRLAQTRWARRSRPSTLDEAARHIEDPASEDRPLRGLVADEEACRLWRVVQTLPEAQRASVLLYYNQGLDVGQVARVLGVSRGTIKTLLFRARRRLRVLLSEHHDGWADGARR